MRTGMLAFSSVTDALRLLWPPKILLWEGTEGADSFVGGAGADIIDGRGGNDTLDGAGGDDVIHGGTGSDSLIGGDGNDYMVGDSGGRYSDTLRGGAGDDSMLGGGGNDRINGSVGADWISGDSGNDLISGGSGNDWMEGDSGNDSMSGGAGNDTLRGGAGNDTMNGGGANDTMNGGAGNDIYYVDRATDKVVETSTVATEIDTVYSTVSFRLHANFENLYLLGDRDLNGTGNGVANTIVGNTARNVLLGGVGDDTLWGGAGSDTLIGGSGADSMIGGAGDDTFYVNIPTDKVVETSTAEDGGYDLVQSTASTFTLGTNVDILVLAGSGSISGTGNEQSNVLAGNSGANTLIGLAGDDRIFGAEGGDTLDGGPGNDLLVGDSGPDVFAFTSALSAATNVDRVDFPKGDAFWLDDAVFVGIGPVGALAAGAIRLGAAAGDADDRIVYNKITGELFFDADGTGATAQILFATLTAGWVISGADFFIV